MWAGAVVFGIKIEIVTIPLGVHVRQVIEVRIIRRWGDMLGLEHVFNQFVPFAFHFRLHALLDLRLGAS